MEVGTVLSTIGQAAATVGKLREAANTLKHAELKSLVAELAMELSDAQLKLAELKDELVALRAENQALKEKQSREKPEFFWGCYRFSNDENVLYCPACYDTKGKKHVTTRVDTHRRQCTVCRVMLGTG